MGPTKLRPPSVGAALRDRKEAIWTAGCGPEIMGEDLFFALGVAATAGFDAGLIVMDKALFQWQLFLPSLPHRLQYPFFQHFDPANCVR